MHRSLALSTVALPALLICATASQADIVINDGTFLDSNWTLIPRPYGPSGGSGSAIQVLSGGITDNGAARLTTNTAGASNSGSYNASIYTAFSYNPAVSGPLSALTISFDARYTDGLSAIGPVVEQGGLIWFGGYEINTSAWQNFSFSPTASDWYLINPSGSQSGPGPDFSAAGSTMRFGYFTANGTSAGGASYTNRGLTDNFVVSFIPSPAAATLLALAALTTRRRAR